jgi:PTS hybrid protein
VTAGTARVGLVIVSHSDLIARGVREVAAQMAPDVRVVPAGGAPGGGVGTDVATVVSAIGDADAGAGVVVLTDLGSAVLSAETAVELLGSTASRVIVVADAPLVEGAVAAAVHAQLNGSVDEVAAVATTAGGAGAEPARIDLEGDERGGADATYVRTVRLTNADGLHARPAAELVKLATSLGVAVTINGADARSMLGILSLGLTQGAVVEIATGDRDGRGAVDELVALVESGFARS